MSKITLWCIIAAKRIYRKKDYLHFYILLFENVLAKKSTMNSSQAEKRVSANSNAESHKRMKKGEQSVWNDSW